MDIEDISNRFNLSRAHSINKLIADNISNQEFLNRNIIVTKQETNKYIKSIASSNNLSLLELQNNISKDMDLKIFEEDIKERIKKEKLIIEILQEKNFSIDERTLKNYYQDNKNKYANYTTIKIKEYISKNKNDLYAIKKNPLIVNQTQTRQVDMNIKNITNLEIKNELISTNKNRFSNIINKNTFYIMFYIIHKKNNGFHSFEKVKNDIYMNLYEKSKNKIVNNYFARQRTKANIIYK